MQKKSLLTLSLLFSFSLISCSNSNNITLNSDFLNSQSVNHVSTQSFSANWYESLPKNLQVYYASARGKTGKDLFVSLNNIISKNNKVSNYKTAKAYMYERIDNNLQSSNSILAAYSQIQVRGRGGNGNSYKENGDANGDGFNSDFINCEHTWPQSLFDSKLPMVADLHHLQSTLTKPNAARSHFPIGASKGKVVNVVQSSGAKLWAEPKVKMSNNELDSLIERYLKVQHIWNDDARKEKEEILKKIDFTFEPPNANKGNTARILMYFFLRYYNQDIKQSSYDSDKFWNSNVNSYISWSSQVDPVDSYEKTRNDRIFQKQGNRNPFIDIPNLGELIGSDTFIQMEKSFR